MNEEKPKEAEKTKETEKSPEPAKPKEAKAELKPAQKAEKSQAQPARVERPKECVSCSKNIQKRWYYREGAYYCSKGCWKKSKKDKKEAEKNAAKPEDKK